MHTYVRKWPLENEKPFSHAELFLSITLIKRHLLFKLDKSSNPAKDSQPLLEIIIFLHSVNNSVKAQPEFQPRFFDQPISQSVSGARGACARPAQFVFTRLKF